MSCLMAAMSVSPLDRIAVTFRLSEASESDTALRERVTAASCSRCAESAAALPSREAVTSSWSLRKSVFDAKQPVDSSAAKVSASEVAFIVPECKTLFPD